MKKTFLSMNILTTHLIFKPGAVHVGAVLVRERCFTLGAKIC